MLSNRIKLLFLIYCEHVNLQSLPKKDLQDFYAMVEEGIIEVNSTTLDAQLTDKGRDIVYKVEDCLTIKPSHYETL